MLESRLADSPVRGLIVDLEAGDTALDLIRRSVESGRAVRTVAFGPHVEVDRLRAAKEAGADHVLVRGAFDRQLVEILRSLDGAPSP